jgi:putative ABC transport system permease protein
MKLIDIIKSANSNLLRNKGRSILTIIAIFIGSFTIILTNGVNTGVNTYIDKQMASAGGEGYLEIMKSSMEETMMSGMLSGASEVREYNPEKNSAEAAVISAADLEKLQSFPELKNVKPYQMVDVEYITSDDTDKNYVIQVYDLPTDKLQLDMATGRKIDVSSSDYEINLLPDYSQALGFDNDEAAIGKQVNLVVKNAVTREEKTVSATVVGVMNKTILSMGRSPINTALNNQIADLIMEGMPAGYEVGNYFATAEFDENYTKEQIKDLQQQLKDAGFSAMTVEDEVGMVKSFFDAVTTILMIFGMIALLAASIGIINTLFMAVQERTREIGLMKAMGLGKGKIFTMFSVEAIALGFWGSALGIAVSYIVRAVANQLAMETFLKDLPGFTLVEFKLTHLVLVVALIMFIAFLAGSLPARSAAKKDPIDALRYE